MQVGQLVHRQELHRATQPGRDTGGRSEALNRSARRARTRRTQRHRHQAGRGELGRSRPRPHRRRRRRQRPARRVADQPLGSLLLRGVGRDRRRDHLDRQVGAVSLAQPAEDAVLLLDDRVVAEDERVLGADVDADVAALAEDRVPADVRVVDPADPVPVIVADPGSEADGGLARRRGLARLSCGRVHDPALEPPAAVRVDRRHPVPSVPMVTSRRAPLAARLLSRGLPARRLPDVRRDRTEPASRLPEREPDADPVARPAPSRRRRPSPRSRFRWRW